jgi:hypothetical protein
MVTTEFAPLAATRLIEQALDQVGEPFYLLYYLGGSNPQGEGLFAVRDPNGSLRGVRRRRPGRLSIHHQTL